VSKLSTPPLRIILALGLAALAAGAPLVAIPSCAGAGAAAQDSAGAPAEAPPAGTAPAPNPFAGLKPAFT
jgi:hypothetical protein